MSKELEAIQLEWVEKTTKLTKAMAERIVALEEKVAMLESKCVPYL